MQLCGVKAGRRLANLTVCHRRAIAGAWCERLRAIARQLHRGSVTGSAHLGRESSTSPRVILVRLCYLAALRGLANISTSITICTLRRLCCCLCAMGHAMSGLWHEPYARTDLVGYDRPQRPERQKRGISCFFLSAKLDVVCKCRADLILDGMYRVSLWRGATIGNETRVVLTFLLESTICIPGGRHGRFRAGGQRASLFCGEFPRGSPFYGHLRYRPIP